MSTPRILVVEDDPDAALFFLHILKNRCHVTHTPDPTVALTLAASQPWDLVITDLDLPTMTGLELLGALRPLAPALPVVIVTAHLPDACATAALRRGADEVLAKPVGVSRLLETVARLTGADRGH